jgi:hypothetical protein
MYDIYNGNKSFNDYFIDMMQADIKHVNNIQ